MSVGYFLRVGDSTTCGGKILTGDSTFQWYGVSAAREGDMVNCGKHSGTYKILGGVADSFDGGQTLAGHLTALAPARVTQNLSPVFRIVTLRRMQEEWKSHLRSKRG
jgi:uncharacterized Zn-binding protein involved in type VI secretion